MARPGGRRLQEYGWTIPVLLDERGEIIAGHGRILAAKKLGYTEAPCMVARGWTEAQIKAYRLADNQIGLMSDWDPALLKVEFEELKALDFNLELTGFSAGELQRYTAGPGLTDPDEVPEPPKNPVSRLGDVWLLGAHRLVCGDATKAEDVAKALGGAKPHLMVADPPYDVDYDPSWADGGIHGVRENMRVGRVENGGCNDWLAAWSLFLGDVAYVWHADKGAAQTFRCCPN